MRAVRPPLSTRLTRAVGLLLIAAAGIGAIVFDRNGVDPPRATHSAPPAAHSR